MPCIVNIRSVCIFLALAFLCTGCNNDAPAPQPTLTRILVFTKAAGFHHASIEDGVTMFRRCQREWGTAITVTDSSEVFADTAVRNYDVVVLLNSTGKLFAPTEREGLQAYVKQGGAILAIHAAADAEYDWPWYGQMLGGWFNGHPPGTHEAVSVVKLPSHPAAEGLPALWIHRDEWYNFKALQPDNTVILNLDETTYSGGTHGADHPICWCREYDGGRIFYTGFGHTPQTYNEPLFAQHIKGALKWLTSK